MRLKRILPLTTLLIASSFTGAPKADSEAPEDVLGNIVVVAGANRPLPRIAIAPSLSSASEDVLVHGVMRRDLDLSGEFDLLSDDEAPEEALLMTTIQLRPWLSKRIDALIEVSAHRRESDGQVEITGKLYLVTQGDKPAFIRNLVIPADELRPAAHRLVDALIGALTGTNGGFASHMTFVSGAGLSKRVYEIDADGHNPKAISPLDEVAIAPAFGKDGELMWAASKNHGEYALRTASGKSISLPIKGSVYGLAFSRDRNQVAVSIGTERTIELFIGPTFEQLTNALTIGMALRPTFTPSGKVAFSGESRFGQRIYVGDKPITPDGLFASAPTFCNHPGGVRVIFAAGMGKNTDLVMANERGGDLVRLTQNQGRNGYPACSPDGRLVAFFSTRNSGEGPGLYIMRLDGARTKRISTLLGDSLRWDSLPVMPAPSP